MVQKTNLPFDGIETLMLNSDYKIAIYPGTIDEDAFQHSNNPVMKKAWKERIEPYVDFYKEFFSGMHMYIFSYFKRKRGIKCFYCYEVERKKYKQKQRKRM